MTCFKREKGISYSFIKSNKFKTTLISVGFYLPLSEDAAANSLALALMRSGTEALPDTYSLNRKLAGLYGAAVSSWVGKQGDFQELRIGLAVNDDRYTLSGSGNVETAGNLLCDMIFGRFLSDTDYPEDAIAREKRLLCEKIEGAINEKRLYARSRLEEIMCKGEPYGLSPDGTVGKVNSLTDGDIKAALKRLIANAKISVVCIGENEPTCFIENFSKCITAAGREYTPFCNDIIKPASPEKTETEVMAVNQGKLVMGFRTIAGGTDRDTVALLVMNDILGGGPYSKLFCNVREKMSLCYYCSSRAIRRKGLVIVDSGVEEKNIEAAKKAVLQQLENIVKGDVTDKEFSSSKLAMCDMLRSVYSDQGALLRWYSARALEDNPASPEEINGLIEKITLDDIVKAAADLKLDTVYELRPESGKEETP